MKLVLAYSVALSAGGFAAQAAADIPVWVYLIGTVLGTGFGGKWILDRRDKKWGERLQQATAEATEQTARRTTAETANAVEELQASLISRARAVNAEMQAELANVKTQLAQANERAASAETLAAQKDTEIAKLRIKVQVISARLEALHDEIVTLRHGDEFGKRRLDEESPEA